MKKPALAAGLVLAATAAVAQNTSSTPAPQVPKHSCEAPAVPGATRRQDLREMDRFNKAAKAYKECMQAYIAERQAASKAQIDAANAAAEEYNQTVKKMEEELK